MEDVLLRFRKYYHNLPPGLTYWLGNLYCALPKRLKYGKLYSSYEQFLNISQFWTREKIISYQNERLRELINHAYANVPFYRELFAQAGIQLSDIKDIQDIKKIPPVDKESVRRNVEQFKAENMPQSAFIPIHTGGSTGTPLSFYYERGRTWGLERAFMSRQWKWVGYDYCVDRTVILRGNVINESWFEYDPVRKALILSSYLLTPENALLYFNKIQEYQPTSVQAYPSVITLLASYLKEQKVARIPSLRVILCGSERIMPNQRELIESVFGCRTYSWYGQSECVCLAGECEINSAYHIYSEYGITELLDKEGNEVTQDGQVGEIVATGFNNYAMPFIRYRTGDLAMNSTDVCRCGRPYPLLKRIEGRKQELALTKAGHWIALNPIVFGIHSTIWQQVHAIQFVQHEAGKLDVRVIHSSDRDKDKVAIQLKEILQVRAGNRFNFHILFVDEIERAPNGKAKFLIQYVSMNNL